MQRQLANRKSLLTTELFTVEQLELTGSSHPYYRLATSDWVNILPIVNKSTALLIRQQRVGPMANVLEIPGGALDPDEGADATAAAIRELEEETGYTSQRILGVGSINPNPALFSNRVHFFVALDCQPANPRRHFADAEEHIEVVPTPVAELDDLVRFGRIDHALSALGIMLAGKYVSKDMAQ